MRRTLAPASTSLDNGFSLTEVLVSCALLLLLVSAVVAVANPVMEAAQTQPEAVDLQQRARVAAAALFKDLYVAGAGPEHGALAGSLGRFVATILPRRIGAEAADAPTVARPNVVSLIWVPATRTQSTLVAPFSTAPMGIRQEPGCPPRAACGVDAGMSLLLFDWSGAVDLMTAETADVAGASVRIRGAPSGRAYGDDAAVVEGVARTYYVDASARQLRRYDTDRTDVPLADDVVSMSVEYFGAGTPPASPRPPAGQANCLYDAAGERLPGMAVLSPAEDGLAVLPLEIFTDGPWCGSGGTVFDADLLRVRRVRVRLRLQAAAPSLRAADGRFANPGTGTSASRSVPDQTIEVDVSPRNLAAVE